MTYRRDIDGLRGLAVAFVVLYHARPALLPGGYVGVDVFFVISGFLIFRLLIGEIETGRFNSLNFLERRMRRILPALVTVAAATAVAGYFILGPLDYRRLGQSILALSVAAPNIYFWRDDDYFTRSMPEHPLLHTWSLGVEEQFYLLAPLFLLLIAGFSRRSRLVWMCLLFGGSLFLCVLWTGNRPVGSFFLLPTRAWELLLGGLIAFRAPKPGGSALLLQAAAIAGLVTLVAAATLFGSLTQFPGVAALLPCAGSAAVIWACSYQGTLVGTILGTRMLVATGLISYSLYLWHWPAFTLARYLLDRDLQAGELLAVLTVVVGLSYLTWRCVEMPFRSGTALPSSRRWWVGAVTAVATVAAGALGIVLANGLPGRLPAAALAYQVTALDRPPDTARCHHGAPELVGIDGLCIFNAKAPKKIAIWGDSHANALVPVLRELTELQEVGLVQASYSSCPPLIRVDVARMPTTHRCREFNEMVLAAVPRLGIEKVILAASWSVYFGVDSESRLSAALDIYSRDESLGDPDSERLRLFERSLQETVRRLEQAGVEAWIVRSVPLQPRFVANTLAKAVVRGRDPEKIGITLVTHRQDQKRIDEVFARLPASVKFIDPAVSLCVTGVCVVGAEGKSYYIDTNHLSVHGARLLAEVLQPVVTVPPLGKADGKGLGQAF